MPKKHITAALFIAGVAALAMGCGSSEKVELTTDGGGSGGDGGGGSAGGPCTPSGTQCNNCLDDDGDGLIDGMDPECISAADQREDSFATGIPGDNMDAVQQDCFFDGDSGQGNDGCNIHVCCLLDVNGTGDCPSHLQPDRYDPDDCTPSQRCIDNCGAITPPGCDCFGCCTICADGECHDVLINTNDDLAPECDEDVLGDPTKCLPCSKLDACDTGCDPASCILCPGQTQDDLPASCNDQNECPDGLTSCSSNDECTDTQFCASGCCIDQIG